MNTLCVLTPPPPPPPPPLHTHTRHRIKGGYVVSPYVPSADVLERQVYVCLASTIFPLRACSFYGWPIPCARSPGVFLSHAPQNTDAARTAFRNAATRVNTSDPNGAVITTITSTVIQKIPRNAARLPKQDWGGVLSDDRMRTSLEGCQTAFQFQPAQVLLKPIVTARLADRCEQAEEILKSMQCLRDETWPSLLDLPELGVGSG